MKLQPRHIEIISRRNIWFTISGVLVLLGLFFLVFRGLNLGIDFTGGTLLERDLGGRVSTEQVRAVLHSQELHDIDFGKGVVQTVGGNNVLIRTRSLTNAEIKRLDAALEKKFGFLSVRRTEMVGPVIGKEILTDALWALLIAAAGVLVYVSVRFELRYGIAAIVALVHDVIIGLGFFALIGWEVNTPFIAAMLTVVGYSINDTIVLFDRIRENMRFRKGEDVGEIANQSIIETLARSINTSITTLFVVVALFLLGGSTIKNFTLALLIGIVSGTYSSIFIASPIWVAWKKWQGGRSRRVPV